MDHWEECVLSRVQLFVTPWTVAPPPRLLCGIFQARILEWIAIPYSWGSSPSRDWTCISWVSYIGRRILYQCKVLYRFTTWAKNFQMYKATFRKGSRTRDQIANILCITEKSREFQKSASLTTLKPLTLWITTNCGKFSKWWQYQTN